MVDFENVPSIFTESLDLDLLDAEQLEAGLPFVIAMAIDFCDFLEQKSDGGRLPTRYLSIVRTELETAGLFCIASQGESQAASITDGLRGIS